MKILFVTPHPPWPLNNGTSQRVYHLLRALTAQHDVTLVAWLNSSIPLDHDGRAFPLAPLCEKILEIPIDSTWSQKANNDPLWAPFGNRLVSLFGSWAPAGVSRWRSSKLVEILQHLRQEENFDVVWVERHFVADSIHRAGFRKNVILDLDELSCSTLFRQLKHSRWYRSKPFHYLELLKLALYEQFIRWRFQKLVLCKDEDRHFFGPVARSVAVIPNGVEDFPPADRTRERPWRLLFTGTLSYEPNVDAICRFANHIFPEIRREFREAEFHIVGRSPDIRVVELRRQTGCFVHPNVPDMTPFFDEAPVVVAPIRLGSGTRLKVLEALARGKAVVASSTGVEGLSVRPGIDLEVADTPEDFARACIRLLKNSDLRHRLGTQGQKRVREFYRWEVIEHEVRQLVLSLIASRTAAKTKD